MNILSYIILGLMAVYVFLVYGNIRSKLPFLSIASRWIRWILSSLLIAYFARQWALSEKPLVVLIGASFLFWFLIESILVWINIRMLNFSSIPLFPRFSINHRKTQWPNQKRFIQLKEFLRSNGFKEGQSIKTSIAGTLFLYSPIYIDSSNRILLQFLFLPQRNGTIDVRYILISSTLDGKRYITDNIEMPFGGYVPQNWFKVRKPFCDSLETLLELHSKRLNLSNEIFVTWEDTPLDEINHQQSVLEYYNIKEGFLNPPNLYESYGKLTPEGRYRLWKQFLFLKYLGVCLR